MIIVKLHLPRLVRILINVLFFLLADVWSETRILNIQVN